MFKINVGPLKSPGGDTTLYIFEPTLEPLIPKTNKQRKGSKKLKKINMYILELLYACT